MIDNNRTFITQNGAPRQALYNDAIHPSIKGTARLAVNFKQILPQLPSSPVNEFTNHVTPPVDQTRAPPTRPIVHNMGFPRKIPRPEFKGDSRQTVMSRNSRGPPTSSVADFPLLSSQRNPPEAPHNIKHLHHDPPPGSRTQDRVEDYAGEALAAPVHCKSWYDGNLQPPFPAPTVPPQLPPFPAYPSSINPNNPYPRFPGPYPYPPYGTDGKDGLLKHTNYPYHPAASGLYPPAANASADSRSWFPPNPAGQCAQQLINLASQLMS